MLGDAISQPATEGDVCALISEAAAEGRTLELIGGGSKAAFGMPTQARRIDMTGLAGIVDYDPAELVLTVRPGTPLKDIEELIAGRDQMLAFEPFDHGPLYGMPAGRATIGGVVAAGVAGSQRLSGGGARDHLLGFRAVSGRGEAFVAGAKVVKNVTGYDLPKLAAGSWGRLFALTELTLKVLPRPRVRDTWVVEGLSPTEAVAAMAAAMAGQAEVAAAAHLPATVRTAGPLTAMRVQGFGPSVIARGELLAKTLAPFGAAWRMPQDESTRWWQDLAEVTMVLGDDPLWRVNVPPSGGVRVAAAAERMGARWLFDWAGGLVWVAGGDPNGIRAAAVDGGGHATLIRAPISVREKVPAFPSLTSGVEALEARVRRAFDPKGVFETGRF